MSAHPGAFAGVDPDLVDMVESMFAAERDVVASEDPQGLTERLWHLVEKAGLPWLALAEGVGGTGGSVRDLAAVVYSAARWVAPVPLVESHLAAWLLTQMGLDRPVGPLAFATTEGVSPSQDRSFFVVDVDRLPWGTAAHAVVVVLGQPDDGGTMYFIAMDDTEVEIGPLGNPNGEPSVALRFPNAVGQKAPITAEQLMALKLRRQLLRSAQVAGALDRISAMTFEFAAARTQFGKPINSFQGVQQNLVLVEQHAAMTAMVAEALAWELDTATSIRGPAVTRAAETASIVVSRCTGPAVLAAHQVHGAIGITREYPLQRFTRRARAWSCGVTDADAALALGNAVLGTRSEDVYGVIAEPWRGIEQ